MLRDAKPAGTCLFFQSARSYVVGIRVVRLVGGSRLKLCCNLYARMRFIKRLRLYFTVVMEGNKKLLHRVLVVASQCYYFGVVGSKAWACVQDLALRQDSLMFLPFVTYLLSRAFGVMLIFPS